MLRTVLYIPMPRIWVVLHQCTISTQVLVQCTTVYMGQPAGRPPSRHSAEPALARSLVYERSVVMKSTGNTEVGLA